MSPSEYVKLQINHAGPNEDHLHGKAGRETTEGVDVVVQSVWYVAAVQQQRGDPGASCPQTAQIGIVGKVCRMKVRNTVRLEARLELSPRHTAHS